MRLIHWMFKDDRQWRVILAICLSTAFGFLVWLCFSSGPEPMVNIEDPVVVREDADAGVPYAPFEVKDNDEIEMFRVGGSVSDKLPKGVKTTAGQTVAVRVHDGSGTWYGSGFVVRSGLVVSAAHVLDHVHGDYELSVICNGDEVPGKVLGMDRDRDVVAIAAACKGMRREFDQRPLKVNETVYLSGYTYTFAFKRIIGVVADRYVHQSSPLPDAKLTELQAWELPPDITAQLAGMKRRNLMRHVAVTGVAIPGHSGSVVVNEDGAIVGMVVIRDPARGRSFIIPARLIVQLLNNYKIRF